MNWLLVLRNTYSTQTRVCAAIVDDFGNLIPVDNSKAAYHFGTQLVIKTF